MPTDLPFRLVAPFRGERLNTVTGFFWYMVITYRTSAPWLRAKMASSGSPTTKSSLPCSSSGSSCDTYPCW